MKKIVALLLGMLLLSSCVTATKKIPVQYGAKDEKSAELIDRINNLADLRLRHDFLRVSRTLENDLRQFSDKEYGRSRILNELAEIYSVNILDIERAIEFDELLLKAGVPEVDHDNSFMPLHQVASQRIIANKRYFDEYVRVTSKDIRDRSAERLSVNRQMLEGKRASSQSQYTKDALLAHLSSVRDDVSRTHKGTPDRVKIMSRLLKAEYELHKVDRNFKIQAFSQIGSEDFPFDRINLTEIDFLSLSDYLYLAFRLTGEMRYAQLALDAVYRPYSNIRNSSARWKYNKLINEFISTLISESFNSRRFDDLLYYVSLNKSRMLLEERLAFSKGMGTSNVSDVATAENIPRTSVGLPEKAWFQQRLALSGPYLDFYVDGKYMPLAAHSKQISSIERSTMPLSTRDFGVEDTVAQADGFVDDALFITMIDRGRVASVKKIAGKELIELKRKFSNSYMSIAGSGKSGTESPALLKSLRSELSIPAELVISPDKWIAAHPLDFHLDAKVTRSVNFFMASDNRLLQGLQVSGFFNPTLDLAGAEEEAAIIRREIPTAQIFMREAAQIAALEKVQQRSVLHLSMHGAFNSSDPKNSKLFFSGATRGLGENDPNALYARDMGKYTALRERDLVFAAACQTGLSSADQTNENELMGILRPLTANRNRNVILSLWKVDDIATKYFVEAFYQQLVLTNDVRVSFHGAQDRIRKKYKLPYYWAAFYLSQSQ